MSRASGRVQLTRAGLHLDGEIVPLLVGSVHYWRLERASWKPCLQALKDMGMRLVDTYIPWGVHEVSPGKLDLGAGDERRDVAAFLRIAQELGLYAVIRPGPHINAELTYFGLPERVVWDEACQARSPRGNPVILPFIPRMFPVPSYASDAFSDEVTRYFHLLGEALSPLRYPDGPIVLIQIDNEGAMYFRDGVFDQDYHPDAIAAYRAMLRRKYGTLTKLRERYAALLEPAEAASPQASTERQNAAEQAPSATSAAGPAAAAPNADPAVESAATAPASAAPAMADLASQPAMAEPVAAAGSAAAPNAAEPAIAEPAAAESAAAEPTIAEPIEPNKPVEAPRVGTRLLDEAQLRFSEMEPPRRWAAHNIEQLIYFLDWAELQEEVIGDTFERFSQVLAEAGLGGIPTTHNFPLAQDTTPLNAERIGRAVDLIGYDYYNRADEVQCSSVARRSTELSVRSDALDVPAYACEIGAGFPPYFPALSEQDSEFTVMTALAHGLRGFNLYMAVERDRWIGAPIDPRGQPRPFADRWRRLCEAIDSTGLWTLRRRTPVRIVVPRLERRIARVMHAFGPASGALFAVTGSGAREACFEDELGLGYAVAQESERFVHACEAALRARGVPYAVVSGEDGELVLDGARWLLLATAGGLDEPLADQLSAAVQAGSRLSIGPRALAYDGVMQPLAGAHPLSAHAQLLQVPSAEELQQTVDEAIEALKLPCFPCSPPSCFVTLFEDEDGAVQIIFAGNPSAEEQTVRAQIGLDAPLCDALSGEPISLQDGAIEVSVAACSVRMLKRASS